MRVFICFLCIVVSTFCIPRSAAPRGSINESVQQFIINQGYHAKVYTIKTQDGYVLDLVRIPHQRQQSPESHGFGELNSQEDSQENQQRPAVLLMPGIMSTYEDFVVGGPTQGLAFRLAEQGYDVYMGNVRGSFYGQKHDTLNAEKDAVFWRHCWHHIGIKDVSAIIDRVREISGQDKIDYIGHMTGSTIFYVLASEMPEYNAKINKMVSLGPVAYMKHSNNAFLKQLDSKIVGREVHILQNTHHKTSAVWSSGWIRRYVGSNTFSISEELIKSVEDDCKKDIKRKEVCSNVYFLINGYNSNHYNSTTIRRLMPRVPSPASSQQILHFVQLMISGRFQVYNETFDRHSQSERVYDLSKVTVPVMVYYAPQDSWSQPEDVQHLMKELPNVSYSERIDSVSNNLDLLFSENVAENIFASVIQKMKSNVTVNAKLT